MAPPILDEDAELEVAVERPRLVAHERRGALLAEAHARPFHPAQTPSRFLHFAFTTEPAEAHADRAALAAFCLDRGLAPPPPGARYHRVMWRDLALRWEQHTEFATYTWEVSEARTDMTGPLRTAWMKLLPQPGPLLVAVDLQLVREDPQDMKVHFGEPPPIMAYVDGCAAIAATDFLPDADGFIRFVVADLGLTPMRAGAVSQRLLELETYRMFALLGLPEAQRLEPDVRSIEQELAVITRETTLSQGLMANHDLLQRLTSLAARLEAGSMASLYRFAASRAYADIVKGRLEAIGEQPVAGHGSFSGFLSRRLDPAMRTCWTMQDRQANLSRKLARAAQLLRTRVDIELEHQNRDLLASMNLRTRLQLRLQETVEALSIAAASYYVVGLIGHAAVLLPRLGLRVHPELATALSIPAVLAAITWYFLHRLHGAETEDGARSSALVAPQAGAGP